MEEGVRAPEADEAALAELLGRYMDAADEGRDIGDELLAGAGPLRAALAAQLHVYRELNATSRALGGTKAPEAPKQFGRFVLVETLGRGGLGNVHRAYDTRLRRDVALKVLQRMQILDQDQRSWIRNEARSIARIDHRGVVKVYEVDEAEGQSFVAMELLEGPTLSAVIARWAAHRRGPDLPGPADKARTRADLLEPFAARIACLAELAEALAYCHEHGVLHRDVKPANVLFDAAGQPKWIDFGLAHLEAPGDDASLHLSQVMFGTAAHLAPEQIEHGRTGIDPRSDQFSFGLLAYECFALANPFERGTRTAIFDAITRDDAPPLLKKAPGVPRDLAVVIHHALERDPAARYPHMAALAADLRRIVAHEPISVRPPSLAHLGHLWIQRHRRGAMVAGTVVALALCTWLSVWIAQARNERDRIRADLTAIRPDTFGEPDKLEEIRSDLQDLQRSAREFDSSFLRTALFGERWPEVDRVVHAWSRKLSELLARDERISEETGVVLQDQIYRALVAFDAELCPQCPDNLGTRLRGLVTYPSDAFAGNEYELTRLTLFDSATLADSDDPPPTAPNPSAVRVLSFFRPTNFVRNLVPGTYRLHVWARGAKQLRYETTFRVEQGWAPAQTLTLSSPRAELWNAAVDVTPLDYGIPGKLGHVQLPKCRLGLQTVTTGEYQRFLDATGEPDTEFLRTRTSEQPAAVSYDNALRYAAWAGARLPTIAELLHAEETGAIVLPSSSELTQGEFVLDLSQPLPTAIDPGWLSYTRRWLQWQSGTDKLVGAAVDLAAKHPFCGFRLAFSTDEPDLYQRLAREPIQK